jgi:hypothetical protein
MRLDMIEISSVLEGRVVPVEVLHPTMDERIPVAYGAVVALEVTVVNRVETDDRCEQADVGFG